MSNIKKPPVPQKPTPKEAVAKIDKIAMGAMEKDVLAAHEQIFGHGSSNAQLPEHMFRKDFLPYFSGKVRDDAKLNITTHWVAIAGTPASEVDVVDESGKVLFSVPPLMTTDWLHSGNGGVRGRSFNEILTHAKNQGARLPHLSDQVIGNQGTQKINSMSVSTDQSSESKWKNIFQRYNIAAPGDKSTPAIGATPSSDAGDELVFD